MRQILIGLGRVHPTQSGISSGEPDSIISCGHGCRGTSICAHGFHYAPDNGDIHVCSWRSLLVKEDQVKKGCLETMAVDTVPHDVIPLVLVLQVRSMLSTLNMQSDLV